MGTSAGLARLTKDLVVPAWASWDPSVPLRAAWGAVVALLALGAMLGLGRLALRARGAPAHQLAAGFGVAVAWWFLAALLGVFNPWTAAVPALGLLAFRPPPLPRWPAWAWALGGVLLLLPLADALAPPVDTDEIYQHLALARLIAREGHLVGGFDHPDGSRPLPLQLTFAALYALGGETAPRLWHLSLVVVLLGVITELSRRTFGRVGMGPWLLLTSFSVMVEAGLAYNDLPAALFVLLAAERLHAGDDRAFGLLAGLALGAKYTAAPMLFGLGLTHILWRRRVPWGAALVVLPLLPWWLHNAADGLHPLFPYAGWPDAALVFSWPQKYGMGRSWTDLALLPWNVLMRARTDSFAFLGRISLGWALLPVALWQARRHPWALALVIGGAGWAAGPQLLRYLLPAAGMAAVVMAAIPMRGPLVALTLASALQNLGPLLVKAPEKVAVGLGGLTRHSYLATNLSAWGALAYLRDEVPADAPVALLLSWQGYHVEQPWRLGSVEDHIPTRYWVRAHGDDALRDLRAEGVRYLLVGDVFFLAKDYPFLSPTEFREQLSEPIDTLRRLLERDATRMYAARRWEVWRLDTDPAPQ